MAVIVVALVFWNQAVPKVDPVGDLTSTTVSNHPLMRRVELVDIRTNAVPPPAVPQVFLQALNQFISNATPYELEQGLDAEAVKFVRTNRTGRIVYLETERHIAEFHGSKLAFFMSRHDGSDARRDPNAMKTWYLASAPWTKDEALKATRSIMEKLNVRPTIVREEYEPFSVNVPDASGQKIRTTPFHIVRFYDAKDAMVISAEFRMGTSGPGRLTRWFDNTPPIKMP